MESCWVSVPWAARLQQALVLESQYIERESCFWLANYGSLFIIVYPHIYQVFLRSRSDFHAPCESMNLDKSWEHRKSVNLANNDLTLPQGVKVGENSNNAHRLESHICDPFLFATKFVRRWFLWTLLSQIESRFTQHESFPNSHVTANKNLSIISWTCWLASFLGRKPMMQPTGSQSLRQNWGSSGDQRGRYLDA